MVRRRVVLRFACDPRLGNRSGDALKRLLGRQTAGPFGNLTVSVADIDEIAG